MNMHIFSSFGFWGFGFFVFVNVLGTIEFGIMQMLAVVVGKVDGHGDARTRVQRFTKGIHNRFGVGSKACGSGVVIALSVEDRQVRFRYI